MQTAVINIKVEPKTKKLARQVAEEMGISLSGLIHGLLKQVIRTREVTLSANKKPSAYLIRSLKEAEMEIKTGWISPAFDNAKDAIAWLHDPGAKYANQLRKKI